MSVILWCDVEAFHSDTSVLESKTFGSVFYGVEQAAKCPILAVAVLLISSRTAIGHECLVIYVFVDSQSSNQRNSL